MCRIMMNGAVARIIQCLYRPPVIAILLYLGHTRPPKKPSNPLLVGFFTIQGVLSVATWINRNKVRRTGQDN